MTPLVINLRDEKESLYFIICLCSVRNEANDERSGLLIPKDSSLTRSLLSRTLSKAFLKTKSGTDTRSLLFCFRVMSFR